MDIPQYRNKKTRKTEKLQSSFSICQTNPADIEKVKIGRRCLCYKTYSIKN
jgi:hypothetical protein